MLVTVIAKTLELKYPFAISRATKVKSENIIVSVKHDGMVGWGEASPNARYGETPESCLGALATMLDYLGGNPFYPVPTIEKTFATVTGEFSAKAALDMALFDYLGKQVRAPLHQLYGLAPGPLPITSFTIAIDSPSEMAQRAREAELFHALKIKVGGPNDRAAIEAIRKVTDKPIRVDANEGWADREMALREIEWMAGQNVELVEQPLAADKLEDAAWLKQRSPLPIFADEAFTTPASLIDLSEFYHGVNIKLQKCGGIQAARESISVARAKNLKVMLGCMIESSLGISAAAQLGTLADYLDLDGHLLLTNNPFDGLVFQEGRLVLNNEPGLGVQPNTSIMMPDPEHDSDYEDY